MILARVEWKGVAEAQKRIERRIFKLTGKDPVMFGEIQQIPYKSTAMNFASQGRPGWKARKYVYAWPILAKTGKLLDTTLKSILRPWQHMPGKHTLNISSIFYGLFHQYGMGQEIRRYVSLLSEEKKAITTILRKHLRGD
jgi:phage gpG-like protein